MVRRVGTARIALADQSCMVGHRDTAMVDLDLGRIFVERHGLTNQALLDRVAIRLERDIPVQVHHPIKYLVDRWQRRW